jgi:hypothetical protein
MVFVMPLTNNWGKYCFTLVYTLSHYLQVAKKVINGKASMASLGDLSHDRKIKTTCTSTCRYRGIKTIFTSTICYIC